MTMSRPEAARPPAAMPAPAGPRQVVAMPAAGALRPVPQPPRPVAPPAPLARRRGRHIAVFLSFLALVVAPTALSAWYLHARAADQYASTVAFSVRAEDAPSAVQLLGGITEIGGSGSADADILYEYIASQRIVAEIDAALDLRAIWSRPANDPIFAYDAPGTIEDLVDHWGRMVRTSYDAGTGLIEVRTLAFTPADATSIATAIHARGTDLVNALSDTAQADAIRLARVELDGAVEALKDARAAVTAFRNRNRLVDPGAEAGTQTALIGELEGRLAAALIEQDLLSQRTRAGDPRLAQAELTVEVIRSRIAAERGKMGTGDGAALADVVGEYERLQVDRRFAENSYTAALAAHAAARAEARAQNRYLAAHVEPTVPEAARFPRRGMIAAMVGLFAFLGWATIVLVVYALRDRR
ncbi:capsule biosynthesis protein [Jannaschia sp. KMU-145]|uniref:capsule biosynthesis protein n=1 Tax=Jannaschia halovivens TaxID=3388667 RepID=UPI00396B3375